MKRPTSRRGRTGLYPEGYCIRQRSPNILSRDAYRCIEPREVRGFSDPAQPTSATQAQGMPKQPQGQHRRKLFPQRVEDGWALIRQERRGSHRHLPLADMHTSESFLCKTQAGGVVLSNSETPVTAGTWLQAAPLQASPSSASGVAVSCCAVNSA